jgi:hypothetical protein
MQNEKSKSVSPLVEPFDQTFFSPISLPINSLQSRLHLLQVLLLFGGDAGKKVTQRNYTLLILQSIPLIVYSALLFTAKPSLLDGLYNFDQHLDAMFRQIGVRRPSPGASPTRKTSPCQEITQSQQQLRAQ